jgi:hypothetical protein
VEISQPNNATRVESGERRFGIRVSAPPEDPFTRLVGRSWHTFHWFTTAEERDRVMREMGARHLYSRIGDAPSIVLEPVEREAGQSGG